MTDADFIGKQVRTQAESDVKYKMESGQCICRQCGSVVMAINEVRTVPVWEFPNTCAGCGNVETETTQHPFCPKCEKELGDELVGAIASVLIVGSPHKRGNMFFRNQYMETQPLKFRLATTAIQWLAAGLFFVS